MIISLSTGEKNDYVKEKWTFAALHYFTES